MATIYIQKWFMYKIKSELNNWYEISSREVTIVKETDKAYEVSVEVSRIDGEWDGTKQVWVPKSCTMTEAEYQAELKAEQQRFEDGCKAYEKLIAFAKENGVKGVRSGMRKSTIEQKIREAGIAYA